MLSSDLLNNAIAEFEKLPGIGYKTAMRLIFYLLNKEENEVAAFSTAILKLKKEAKFCKICMNLSESEICNICSDNKRNKEIICVVENINDLLVIENTLQYKGLYHITNGLISPMDGINPENLNINSLIDRIKNDNTKEILLSLNTTVEGDLTNFYIYKQLKAIDVKITTLARGVADGGILEFTDEITLGKSITNRILFEQTFNNK